MTLRRRLAAESGFTMLVTLGVLTVCAALTAAAFGAVTGDMPLRKQSREKKIAFAAAEAGVNFYLSRLNQDNEYWSKCTDVPAPNATEPSPINQPWDGTGADPRNYRFVPGSPARYTLELLPVTGTQCNRADAAGSMIDPATGTMRVRATGLAGCASPAALPAQCSAKRSVIITLRRKSFLDYLYFTDYETLDPTAYGNNAATAATNCRKYRKSRSGCTEIQFAASDYIKGPFHTNDDILTCDGATFGRADRADRLEATGPAPGYTKVCGATPPTFNSTWQAGVAKLDIPTSNAKITSVAVAPYILTGTQSLELNGTSMKVTPLGKASYTLPLPPNGVLWVKNGAGCGAGVSPGVQAYTEPAGCANVYVHGTYGQSLTLVSDKDIIVDGDISRGSDDNLLGLIATNFIRVYHPVTNRTLDGNGLNASCTNDPSTPTNVKIDAAILTLEHSFIVDNWNCGASLGKLTVTGAIVQRFRGPVGTSGGTGYIKNYTYDDRLKYRNPPSFLDPVSASWRLLRENEQVPAR